MSREAYIERRFSPKSRKLIFTIDAIITDYIRQGYVLTVRQLYYQLVARALIPNSLESYKSTAELVNDARLAGLLDWSGIEDRTRSFIRRSHWESGNDILDGCARGYYQDMWANQANRVFVIVEKEALAGVLDSVCSEIDVPLLAARGYPSGTVLREFTEYDILPALNAGQGVVILHLGDHDPSGIDMTRDLTRRIELFARGGAIDLQRIALNMDQIEEQSPPENPAKVTDSRFRAYQEQFGDSSWELDALTPQYLSKLVREKADEFIDPDRWEETQDVIARVRAKLGKIAKEFKA